MNNWQSQMAVFLQKTNSTTGTADGPPIPITPIDSFQQTVNTPAVALHSLEQTHVGAVFAPADIQFTMTVKQNASVLAVLTKIALDREPFQILVNEGQGDSWALASIVLDNCVITSMQAGPFLASAATTGNLPTILINGVSLHTTYTMPDGTSGSVGSLA
jgi:hypothetical protein